jgi:bifunctional aspartokinase / homoserine dehydrogenase 1
MAYKPSDVAITQTQAKKPLRVMKFGGTSVGDGPAISSVVDIIVAASRESSLVVVVSAMSGVTNRLLEAATRAVTGDSDSVSAIMDAIREQHYSVVNTLLHSETTRDLISRQLGELFREADGLCNSIAFSHELTLPVRDSILGLGERLSAPLIAAVLADRDFAACAVDATSLIVTNSNHGGADPILNLTRENCEAHLRPLLQKDVVPVVTGFIGATPAGVPTTLGRGGSDYSATILGAALRAVEVVIWTDVHGIMTADPRLVAGTCTIPEISYREAADLAYFGAKVLHRKTLCPVSRSGVPVWIRNTFAPEFPGTKIAATAPPTEHGVRAVTAIADVALIRVAGPSLMNVSNALCRTLTTIAAIQSEILLISQSSSQNEFCFAVPSAFGPRIAEAVRREFIPDLAYESTEYVSVDTSVAIVALVGQKAGAALELVSRTMAALERERLRVIAVTRGSSGCNVSFVVAAEDMKAALVAAHSEFRLDGADIPTLTVVHNPGSSHGVNISLAV